MTDSHQSRARLIQLVAALAVAWVVFGLYPTGYNGGRGDDDLSGTRGADRLIGGRGKDLADGGRGRDTCQAERRKSCER